MEDTVAIILGGGRGTRLFPLTKDRSKPAVPIAANYRLIDVAVSNCLHANIRRIFVLTQYQSESLNRHVANTYKFDMFSSGCVTILAAEQTEENSDWFQGTADAVRQSMKHVGAAKWSDVAILGGDQLYRMSLRDMLEVHRSKRADATVATKPVPAEHTSGFGIMRMDESGRINHFEEKPKADRLPSLASRLPDRRDPVYLASMGIYVFERRALERALEDPKQNDFGRHVIPGMLAPMRVQAYLYDDYWEDVGTIRSYYEANLALTSEQPPFSFHDVQKPIYTHPRFLSPTKLLGARVKDAIIADGCYVADADVEQCVIGVRSRIGARCRLRRTLVLGADLYETPSEMADAQRRGIPPIGVGDDSIIEGAIIDKNARIGRGVRILNERGDGERDGEHHFIREGVVIVPKGAVIPDGTVI